MVASSHLSSAFARRNERGAEPGAVLLHAIRVSFRMIRNICNTRSVPNILTFVIPLVSSPWFLVWPALSHFPVRLVG